MQERRKSPRQPVPYGIVAAIQTLIDRVRAESKATPDPVIKGNVVDLSRDGAGLSTRVHSNEAFAVGQDVRVAIELSDHTTIDADAEVRWIKTLPKDKGYTVGLSFTHVDHVNRERLLKFLDELDEALAR